MLQKYKVTAFSLLLFIVSCLSSQSSKSEVIVSESLNPGKDQSLALVAAAKGVQTTLFHNPNLSYFKV